MATGEIVLPKVEFINDVAQYVGDKNIEEVLANLNDAMRNYKLLESQLTQKKARSIVKLPEMQKALDIVKTLIDKSSEAQDILVDFDLAEGVYAKARIKDIKSVKLWLGAGVMLEYPLEEARELLDQNLSNCKANINTLEEDLDIVKDSVTTLEVSISRIWNYDVERRRKEKEGAASA